MSGVFKCIAYCIRETDKALLVQTEGEELWIPKSQIHDDSEVFDAEDNNEGLLAIPEWLAEEKGIL